MVRRCAQVLRSELFAAVRAGDLGKVKTLIERQGVDVNTRSTSAAQVFEVSGDDVDDIDVVAGYDVPIGREHTIAHACVRYDPAQPDGTCRVRCLPLLLAQLTQCCLLGADDLLAVLSYAVSKGLDTSLCDSRGRNALHFACSMGDAEVVTRLLRIGDELPRTLPEPQRLHLKALTVRARAPGSGWTPLHFAAFFGHMHVIEVLAANGAHSSATVRCVVLSAVCRLCGCVCCGCGCVCCGCRCGCRCGCVCCGCVCCGCVCCGCGCGCVCTRLANSPHATVMHVHKQCRGDGSYLPGGTCVDVVYARLDHDDELRAAARARERKIKRGGRPEPATESPLPAIVRRALIEAAVRMEGMAALEHERDRDHRQGAGWLLRLVVDCGHVAVAVCVCASCGKSSPHAFAPRRHGNAGAR